VQWLRWSLVPPVLRLTPRATVAHGRQREGGPVDIRSPAVGLPPVGNRGTDGGPHRHRRIRCACSVAGTASSPSALTSIWSWCSAPARESIVRVAACVAVLLEFRRCRRTFCRRPVAQSPEGFVDFGITRREGKPLLGLVQGNGQGGPIVDEPQTGDAEATQPVDPPTSRGHWRTATPLCEARKLTSSRSVASDPWGPNHTPFGRVPVARPATEWPGSAESPSSSDGPSSSSDSWSSSIEEVPTVVIAYRPSLTPSSQNCGSRPMSDAIPSYHLYGIDGADLTHLLR
jgi:hypothetical protein